MDFLRVRPVVEAVEEGMVVTLEVRGYGMEVAMDNRVVCVAAL